MVATQLAASKIRVPDSYYGWTFSPARRLIPFTTGSKALYVSGPRFPFCIRILAHVMHHSVGSKFQVICLYADTGRPRCPT